MFNIETRNARLLNAHVRLTRATGVAERAQAAIERRDDAQAEVDWLRAAPVKDGEPGEGLPSDDEVAEFVKNKISRGAKSDDDTAADADVSSRVDSDSQFI